MLFEDRQAGQSKQSQGTYSHCGLIGPQRLVRPTRNRVNQTL